MTVKLDANKILGKVNELEKVLIPRASKIALNRAVFDAMTELREFGKRRGYRDYSVRGFRFTKPEPQGSNTLVASVFINEDRNKGNARSDYLRPQIYGGKIFRTRFQRALQRTPVGDQDPDGMSGFRSALSPNTVAIPTQTKLVRRRSDGGMSQGVYAKILADLGGGNSSADRTRMRAESRRLKRQEQRNKRRKGKTKLGTESYFFMTENMAADRPGLRSKKEGIYYRNRAGKIGLVFSINKDPIYRKTLPFFEIAGDTVKESFRRNLLKEVKF